MRLTTNQNAFVARRNVGLATDAFARHVERLSSGLRINRAADDAAGLSIAEKLRAQLRGLLMAQQYTQEGINLVQTADGALDQVSSVLHRMRDLAVQASNATMGSDELQAVNLELQALRAEVDNIQASTMYNGRQLLVGTSTVTPVTTTTVNLAGSSILAAGSTVTGITPPMTTVVAATSPMQTGSTYTGPGRINVSSSSQIQGGTSVTGSYSTSTTTTTLDPTSQLGSGTAVSGTHTTSTTSTTLNPASNLQPGGTVTSPPSAPVVAAGSAYNTGDVLTGSQTVTTSTTTASLDPTSPLRPGDTVSGAPNPDTLAAGSALQPGTTVSGTTTVTTTTTTTVEAAGSTLNPGTTVTGPNKTDTVDPTSQLQSGSALSGTYTTTTNSAGIDPTSEVQNGTAISGSTTTSTTTTVEAAGSTLNAGTTVTGPNKVPTVDATSALQSGSALSGTYTTTTNSAGVDPASKLQAGTAISGSTTTISTVQDPTSTLKAGTTVTGPNPVPTVDTTSSIQAGTALSGTHTWVTNSAGVAATSKLQNGTALSGTYNSTGLDPTSTLKSGTTVTSTLYPPDVSSTSNIKAGTVLTGGSGGTSQMQITGLTFTSVAGSKATDQYNLTYASGGNVTLTRVSDGLAQTIAVPNASYSAGQSGSLAFTTLGVTINFTVTSGSFNNVQSASVFGGHSISTVGQTATATLVDVSGAPVAANTYTMTSSGSTVTLTRAADGVTQTLTVAAIAAGGTETLNFSTFGINLDLSSTNGIVAANLANALSQTTNNTIKTQVNSTTQTASVSTIDVSAAPAVATTYTFTSSTPGQVTLTRASDGATQTLTLADIAAGGSQTLNFSTLGVVFTITSASGIKASALSNALTSASTNQLTTQVNSTTNTATQTGSVTALDVSGAQHLSQTYTFSSTSPGTLTLTRSSDGLAQTISVADIVAGGSEALNFTSLGVVLTVGSAGGMGADAVIGSLTKAGANTFKTISNPSTASVTSVNVSSAPAVNDSYTLSSTSPGTLTLTRASNGATQTLTLASIAAGGSQTINFSTLGISFVVNSTGGISASDLATALSAAANNTIKTTTSSTTTTENATVSAIDVSAAPAVATTYTFTSSSPGTVTLTRASDGATQTLTLAAIAAGGTETLNFSALGGPVFTITSAGGITAQNLANALTAPTTNSLTTKVNTTTTTTTQTATLTTLDVSGAAHQNDTYTLTSTSPGTVTLTRASDGANQTLTLADIAAGGSETLNWNTLGVVFTITSSGGIKASALANALTTAPNNSFKTVTSNDTATVSAVNVSGAPAVNDTYTLSSTSPGMLTLTRASNAATQTVTVASLAAGGSEVLNFSTLGISLTVGSTGGIVAADLATALAAPANNTIKTAPQTTTTTTTQNAVISNVDLSAAPAVATTYTMTSSAPGQVTLTRASDGATQTLTLSPIAAGGSETLNFSTLGAVYTVTSTGGITAQNLSNALTALANDDLITKVNSTTTTTTQNATLTTLDVSGAPHQNDTYTLTSTAPGTVTLTRASDGANQTLTLADIAAGGSAALNWNTLGIVFTISSTGGIKASALANALTTAPKNTFKTLTSADTANVTAVNVSSAPAVNDTYTLSSTSPGTLTLTRASNGATQTLTLTSIAPGGTETINFSTLGISLTVGSTGGMVAADLATALAAPANNTIKTAPNTTTTTTTQTDSAQVTAIDVSGARPANDTYTLSRPAAGQLTLTRGDGVSQTITLANIPAGGSAVLDFSAVLGVKISVSSTGGISADALAQGLSAAGKNTFGTTTSTDTAQVNTVDVSAAQATPANTYTLSASGNVLTMTRASDGVTQTLSVAGIAAGGTTTLSFSTLGINIGLSSTSGISGTNLAAGLAKPANNTITTSPNTTTTTTTNTYTANVTSLNVSASQPVSQTYTFSSAAPGQVTLTRSSDGLSQTLTLTDIPAGGSETLNFTTLGIVTSISSSAGITAVALADALIKPANNTFSTSSTTQSATVNTLDVSGAPAANDTYTFTNPTPGQVTLTRTSDGLSQTLAAPSITAGGSGALNFTTLGINLTLGSTGGITATNLAAALASHTFQTQPLVTTTTSTQSGTVTTIDVSAAPPAADTYTFSSTAPGNLTLTRASDGLSQTIAAPSVPAGGSAILDFSATLGVKLTLSSTAGMASDAVISALTQPTTNSFKTQPTTTVTTTTETGLVNTVDISGAPLRNDTLTFTRSGTLLTLTRSSDGASQTITAPSIAAGGSALLDFSATLGVKLTLSSTAGMTAQSVADALTRPTTSSISISYSASTAQVTALNVSSAQAGTNYTFSSSAPGSLTLTRASDGVSQTITAPTIGPGGSGLLSFTTLGISATVRSTSGISSADLATALSTPPNNVIQTVATPSGPPGSATITSIDLSRAQPANQRYTLTRSGSQLTLTRSSDGLSQTITPTAVAAGGNGLLDFSSTLGVTITFSTSTGMSALNVAEAFSQAPNNTFDTTFTSTTTMTTINSDVVDIQVGANAGDIVELVLGEVSINSLGLTSPLDSFATANTIANAQALITKLDSAIDAVSSRRVQFGSFQNRLEHILEVQNAEQESAMSAESRIRDADMAEEMLGVTKTYLLQQLGQVLLAQANVNPRGVLRVLHPVGRR